MLLDFSRFSIGIDGLNLALLKGTGVATYARNLAETLNAAGCKVDLLYGLPITRPDQQSLEFLERLGDGNFPLRPHFPEYQWWIETFQHLRGHRATQIIIEPDIVPEALKEVVFRLPPHNRLFNDSFLFKAAQGFFKTTGRFLNITIPEGPEIMHWTYPVPLRLVGARNIYTLHDLVPLLLPETTLDHKPLYRRLIQKIVKEADGLCTVSETSKNDIIRLFPKSADRLVNTFQPYIPDVVIEKMTYGDSAEIVRKITYCKPGEYYLFFGQLEPKKNIGRILEAFLNSSTERPLILVGSTGWKQEAELRLLPKALASGRVKHVPYLAKTDLMALLRHARALLFPSIAEGFGLPVLEAFSLGTPVLTSGRGALREVAGDCALLVDPYDVRSICEGINRFDYNDELCRKFSYAGKERCKVFSRENYLKRLEALYKMVLYG
ncbi:glycosyltransferase family 1 protein [Acetobacteraceae bacterium ESL0709]|nr:glycosyltransferase family 1 protein [Acetobacteraceae bacterium ESL0697]MDF7677118.1 glycosyltransferase family 1 protein [Acetobacteraceae bacterium ESL0709]